MPIYQHIPKISIHLRTFQKETTNKKTKALTTEQYKEIIQTMKDGFFRLSSQ